MGDSRRTKQQLIQELDQLRKQVAQAQALLRSILDLHDRERELLSHEIHNGFVQDVVGAKMLLESVIARLPSQGVSPQAELESGRALLARAVAEARRVVTELQPMIVDQDRTAE